MCAEKERLLHMPPNEEEGHHQLLSTPANSHLLNSLQSLASTRGLTVSSKRNPRRMDIFLKGKII